MLQKNIRKEIAMKRIVFIIFAFMLFPVVGFSQPNREDCDLIRDGSMSLAALCPEPVLSELDISYADTGNPMHRLDLYLPKNRTSDKLPVMVFFHGGGWMHGYKSDAAVMLMPFLYAGQYAVAFVAYRLTGEAQWPAQIHDCKAAIRWVRANALKYALNADRIGVWGVSAGGHLALMLGVSGDVPALEGDIGPYQGVSSKVNAVVNYFGVSELLPIIDQPGNMDLTRSDTLAAKLIGGPLIENTGKAKAASPITYVTANDPPVLTVHGTKDYAVPYLQSIRLDAALKKVGVPSYFVTVIGGGHGDFGAAANDRVKAFFDKYLRGKDVQISTEPLNQP